MVCGLYWFSLLVERNLANMGVWVVWIVVRLACWVVRCSAVVSRLSLNGAPPAFRLQAGQTTSRAALARTAHLPQLGEVHAQLPFHSKCGKDVHILCLNAIESFSLL